MTKPRDTDKSAYRDRRSARQRFAIGQKMAAKRRSAALASAFGGEAADLAGACAAAAGFDEHRAYGG